MAELSTASINELPDSAFAYIEDGGSKDSSGKTVPRSLRHFPVHDEAHTRNALARAPQSPFGSKAMPKIRAAARKYGIKVSDADGGRSVFGDEETRELRNTSHWGIETPLELRTNGDGKWIGGYATVYVPKTSKNLGGFIERVAPTAFREMQMENWPGVVCRYNHDSNMVLGTTAAHTLRMTTDMIGLDYSVLPPQSRTDILELVQRGDIRHSSFAFRVPDGGDEWGVDERNFPLRTLHSVELVDVAPVLSPGYPDATVAARATTPALRSLARTMETTVQHVLEVCEARGDLRYFFQRSDPKRDPNRPVHRPEPKTLFGPQAAALLLRMRKDPWDNSE